ncbi:MAG: AbrB/MazE/SpoVT family DNA-binding domain-containing protein [Defluviitaleaceae bacterium]|nr:AbrB/MazE/SpoVT family DNA-binding domain-containing protein [Defluviitaleaceae bacterium]
MQTTIQKWGNSQAVRLPKAILEIAFLRENDSVEIVAEPDFIVIKKAAKTRRAKKSLEERFKDYTGDYQCTEANWGAPVGNEVW